MSTHATLTGGADFDDHSGQQTMAAAGSKRLREDGAVEGSTDPKRRNDAGMDLKSVISDRIGQFQGKPLNATITLSNFPMLNDGGRLSIEKNVHGYQITSTYERKLYNGNPTFGAQTKQARDEGYTVTHEGIYYTLYSKSSSPTTLLRSPAADLYIKDLLDTPLLLISGHASDTSCKIELETAGTKLTASYFMRATSSVRGEDGEGNAAHMTEEEFLEDNREVPAQLRAMQEFHKRKRDEDMRGMQALVAFFKAFIPTV